MSVQRTRTITQRVERPVRLSKYMIAKVEASITSEINPDLLVDENLVLKEDREDILTLLDFMEQEERDVFERDVEKGEE